MRGESSAMARTRTVWSRAEASFPDSCATRSRDPRSARGCSLRRRLGRALPRREVVAAAALLPRRARATSRAVLEDPLLAAGEARADVTEQRDLTVRVAVARSRATAASASTAGQQGGAVLGLGDAEWESSVGIAVGEAVAVEQQHDVGPQLLRAGLERQPSAG